MSSKGIVNKLKITDALNMIEALKECLKQIDYWQPRSEGYAEYMDKSFKLCDDITEVLRGIKGAAND